MQKTYGIFHILGGGGGWLEVWLYHFYMFSASQKNAFSICKEGVNQYCGGAQWDKGMGDPTW